jgi:very-short-patch-repair endonuclease
MMLNQSAERRARAAEVARNRVHGPDCKHCQVMKNQSAEYRARTSERMTGQRHPPDCKHCESLRNQSAERRAQTSERMKGNRYAKGLKMTEESRRKMSAAAKHIPDEVLARRNQTYAERYRQEPTEHERMLWNLVQRLYPNEQLEREYPVGRYLIDVAVPSLLLAFEADGWTHRLPGRVERDKKKDAFLESQGWTVIRFTNGQIERLAA